MASVLSCRNRCSSPGKEEEASVLCEKKNVHFFFPTERKSLKFEGTAHSKRAPMFSLHHVRTLCTTLSSVLTLHPNEELLLFCFPKNCASVSFHNVNSDPVSKFGWFVFSFAFLFSC